MLTLSTDTDFHREDKNNKTFDYAIYTVCLSYRDTLEIISYNYFLKASQ